MKARWAVIAAMAMLSGCAQMNKSSECCKKKEGDEVKMTIDQVPGPVRETLMREAGGATIKTVDKEMKDGKTIYETDVMSGGKNWEIKVDPSGNVISKKVDEEKEGGKEGKGKEEEEEEEKEERGKSK